VLQHTLNFIGTSFIDLELVLSNVSEGDVKDGTVFRSVDVFPGEHLVSSRFDTSLLGELQEVLPYFFVDQVLRVVEEDVDILLGRVVGLREFVESLGVRVEKFTKDELGVVLIVELLKGAPRRVI